MSAQPVAIQDAVAEANQLVAQAFALIASIVEQAGKTEDLEALTAQEAMALLRKSKSTIYEMCQDGRLTLIDGRIPKWVIREYLAGKRKPKSKAAKRGRR